MIDKYIREACVEFCNYSKDFGFFLGTIYLENYKLNQTFKLGPV